MVNFGSILSAGGKVGGGIFSRLLRIKWAYVFIVILFIQAISVGISNGGGVQIIISLGERFFNMIQNLHSTSLQIIESGAVFDGYLAFLGTLWAFISNIWLIYLWLKLFNFLWGKSPFSNESEGFKNISFAIGTFYLLQIAYLFFMRYELNVQFLANYGFVELIKLPYIAFVDFFKAVILLFGSLEFSKAVSSVANITSNETIIGSCGQSVCQI